MRRIYLVDDHVLLRDGMRAVLESAGYQVVGEAGEPAQALRDVLRLIPDVVLLDLHLGEHSGLELLAELQRRSLPTRCIVLTMSAQPRQVAESLRLGASGYMLKGSSARELFGAIETVMRGQRHLGPNVADLAVQVLTGESQEDALATLSPRERQIIVMVVKGQSSAAIGEALHLSPKTVDTYRSRLMTKLGITDLPALVRWAIRAGLIDVDGP